MVATPVDRTVAVTVSPAPTADAPWSAYAMVSAGTIVGASSTYQASFGGQAVAVTSSSVAVSYRSADAANTWINLYQGQASPSAPPTAQFSRALADSPSTLVVAVPTLTVSGFSCTVAICTTTLAVTGAPPDARVDAFLAQTSTYSYGNPATVQGQLAGSSVALSFARPTDGSYVVRVYLSPATTTSSIPAWSWSVRLPTTLTVAPSVT